MVTRALVSSTVVTADLPTPIAGKEKLVIRDYNVEWSKRLADRNKASNELIKVKPEIS